MLIKKNKAHKTIQMIENDIRYGFSRIMLQKESIYHLTISNTQIYCPAELRFKLTNKLFNSIHKDNLKTNAKVNFLFVIEYPEKVSRGNYIPENCEVHGHIVLSTTLAPQQLEYYIKSTFIKPDFQFEKINYRKDKNNLVNYLVKQKHLFTNQNYNYKIEI